MNMVLKNIFIVYIWYIIYFSIQKFENTKIYFKLPLVKKIEKINFSSICIDTCII
jgi:hypothetical protein